MKIKIIEIKGCDTCKQVLLFVDRPSADSESDKDYIHLIAWHEHEDNWYIQDARIDAPNISMCEKIINDFSEFSANEFANSMNF